MYSLELYILVVLQGWGLQRVRKEVVSHEAYNKVLPCCKAQWPVEYQRKIKEERYQEQIPGTGTRNRSIT